MQYTWVTQLKKNETYTLSVCVSVDCLSKMINVIENNSGLSIRNE